MQTKRFFFIFADLLHILYIYKQWLALKGGKENININVSTQSMSQKII
jgi:hypothetical protein